MLKVSNSVQIPDEELEVQFVRAQGAGGQNVNKVATAAHLRFNFLASKSLPDWYKQRLLATADQRISREGVIVIKAQRFRSQERNREDAIFRLGELLRAVSFTPKTRRPTAPTRAAKKRRVDNKIKTARCKALRKKVTKADY